MEVSQLLGWPITRIGDVAVYLRFPALVPLSFLQQRTVTLHRMPHQVCLQFQEQVNFYEGKGKVNAIVFSERHLFPAWLQASKAYRVVCSHVQPVACKEALSAPLKDTTPYFSRNKHPTCLKETPGSAERPKTF